jgi:hypothetical protein
VAATPYFIGSFLPAVAELWPSSIGVMAGAVASGSAPNVPTLASWAVALVAVGVGGLLVFDREDL